MKRTSSNSLRSASWTWHISAPILCVVFLSLISPFHLRLALSGSVLPCLPPFMTDSSGSSPSSPNTKPEPRYHQCCSSPNSCLSGSSCASVPLPKPDSKQRCAKYVVKSSKILWNSQYKKSQRLLPHALILPLILTYHVNVVSNEMKRTSSNSLRSASWTWHISAPILCVVFLSLISQFHLRLALSGSILPYLPPFMTDSSGSSPSSPNTKPEPLQGKCSCFSNSGLPGSSCASVPLPMPDSKQRCAKYVVKSSKILWNSHTRNLNAFYRMLSYFRSYWHIMSMWSPMKWKEQAQIHSDLHHGLGTSQHQSSV